MTTTVATAVEPAVGDLVRLDPDSGRGPWLVEARDERFIIVSRQAPFKPRGTLQYAIVDLTGWTREYNGVAPGPVRSSASTIGGQYDMSRPDWARRLLAELVDGTRQLSVRRVMRVDAITVEQR